MVDSGEASTWLDRREIATETGPRNPGIWRAWVAALRRSAYRMQLGPVTCGEPGPYR